MRPLIGDDMQGGAIRNAAIKDRPKSARPSEGDAADRARTPTRCERGKKERGFHRAAVSRARPRHAAPRGDVMGALITSHLRWWDVLPSAKGLAAKCGVVAACGSSKNNREY
ncbi:hypothetical protein MTO96_011031 [Rhipicephalus appendiculatus]